MVRRLVATVATMAAVVALAGCGDRQAGSDDSTSSSIQELSAATFGRTMAAAQSEARSAHLTGSVTVSGHTVRIKGDVQADGKTLDGMQMGLTMTVGPGKNVTMRLVDRVFYMKASPSVFTKNAAKPWVKIDLKDPTNPFGAMFDQMTGYLDPAKVRRMYAAVTRLNNLGVDDVNGVPARHYTVTIDTSRMVSAMGLDKVPGVSRAQVLAKLPDEFTSQVWLDAQNRPVKTSSSMHGATTEMQFSNWGKPVKVSAPPADQVMDFSHLSR